MGFIGRKQFARIGSVGRRITLIGVSHWGGPPIAAGTLGCRHRLPGFMEDRTTAAAGRGEAQARIFFRDDSRICGALALHGSRSLHHHSHRGSEWGIVASRGVAPGDFELRLVCVFRRWTGSCRFSARSGA